MLKPEWLVIGATTLFTGALAAMTNPTGLSVVAGGSAGAVGSSVVLRLESERRKAIATLQTQLSRIEIALGTRPQLPEPSPALPPAITQPSDTLTAILNLQRSLEVEIAALATTTDSQTAAPVTPELITLLALKSKLATLLRDQANSVAHPAPYSVILYDLENLIHGNYDSKRSNYISFRKIRERIANHVDLGTICAQKAYANWSNGKLYSLRFATLEEGVQPIQTYGFRDGENQDKSKNLADFHLFDEALRLLETQPHITTFVIASGDGDFIPLITHLKEHGKRVIVCANAGSENPKLVEFCDLLILIRLAEVVEERDLPDRGYVRRPEPQKPYIIKPKRASWPAINAQIAKRIGEPTATTPEAAAAWIRTLLRDYETNTQASDLLKRIGQPISGFKVFLKEYIPQLDHYIQQVPTRRLKRYLELILADTPLMLVDLEGSIVMALREHLPAKAKLLDAEPTDNVLPRHLRLTHPINERILPELENVSVTTDDEVNIAVAAVLNAYVADAEIRIALEAKGIGLSCLKEMINHLIPEFERWQKQVFGFSKFGYYLRYVCRETEFCIATDKELNSVLLLRDHIPEGCVVLGDRDRDPMPSVAVYADFLKLDVPRLLLPKEQTLPQTARYALAHAQEWIAFAELEALIERESGLKAGEVRAGLHTLVRVGVLETEGTGEVASRSVQLVPVYRDVDTVLKFVEAELRQRLAKHLDTVDVKTLQKLLYPATSAVPRVQSI